MERIGEILAKSLPERSLTLSKLCDCGKQIESYLSRGNKCRDCVVKERDSELRKELEKELPNATECQQDEWLNKCGLPLKFCDKTFDNFDTKLQSKALVAIKNLKWKDEQPNSLLLASPGIYGVGKTHLVCSLINHIIETEVKAFVRNPHTITKNPCPVYFTTENELLRRIRDSYNKTEHEHETEENIYRELSAPQLLIIDDVGKVRARDNSFLQGVYFNVIDERYSNQKAIIMTTNLDYAELEEHIGGACADRLREMCGENFVKMAGKSYRKGVANELPKK